jgi:transposase
MRAQGNGNGHTRNAAIKTLLESMREGHSVREVAKQLGVHEATLRRWTAESDAVATQYAHAREAQADAHADKALEVAENATPENAQAARLLVDTLKWRAAKFRPRVYGERTALEHSGPDGGPMTLSVSYEDADE